MLLNDWHFQRCVQSQVYWAVVCLLLVVELALSAAAQPVYSVGKRLSSRSVAPSFHSHPPSHTCLPESLRVDEHCWWLQEMSIEITLRRSYGWQKYETVVLLRWEYLQRWCVFWRETWCFMGGFFVFSCNRTMGGVHPSSDLTISDFISPIVSAFSVSEWKPWNIHEGFCVRCRGWYWPVHHHKGHVSDQLDHHCDSGEKGRRGAGRGGGETEKSRGSHAGRCHPAWGKGTSPLCLPGLLQIPENSWMVLRVWSRSVCIRQAGL